jgi:hypothetical protein
VAGLASAEPDTRIAAAEVWAQAALDGRLDPDLAASAIVTGVTGGAFKLNRVADGLQHAAPEPLAGYRVVETVFAAADTLIPARPAGLHLLFELAVRTSAAVGQPAMAAALTDLAAQRSSSKLAAAARRLATAAAPVPADAAPGLARAAPDRSQAIAQALTALIARTGPP